jgi:hypothetical protein
MTQRGRDAFVSVCFMTKDTSGNKNDSLYEQLEQVLTDSASTMCKLC